MTEESREYTTMLANTVDKKIRDLLASSNKITAPIACILTSLDLCDEKEKAKASATRLRDEIKNYYERNAELEDKVAELERELNEEKSREDKG